jgi:hypothetical protein
MINCVVLINCHIYFIINCDIIFYKMSYQQIQNYIDILSVKPTFSALKNIVKQFSQYTNLQEQLPP